MRIAAGLALAAFAAAALPARATAQDTRPSAPPELRKAVEAYLAEREDAAAARMLDDVVKRPDAKAESVMAALVETGAEPPQGSTEILVPWKDQLLSATLAVPEGHARAAARLPVVFDVSGGDTAAWLKLERDAVVAFVKKYTPPEFSDEGRDGFLKVVRTAAHRAHGDADRLWLCGFSWAGHASYDVALHRPGVLRGIAPMGGGPRRTWFRLLAQLAPVRVLAFCGEKDDRELVWNLREVQNLAPKLKLSYALTLDPDQGHTLPLAGIDGVASLVRETAAQDPAPAASGTLLADAALVESPFLRIDAVDEKRVAVRPVPVDASASPDAQRRATIAAMASKVAKLGWKIEQKKDETIVSLTSEGVPSATVLLRSPAFPIGRKITVRGPGAPAFSDVLTPDPRTMLADARRTGERLHPVLRSVTVRFQGK
jgi:predicted esterase